jgi:hypothetical protein
MPYSTLIDIQTLNDCYMSGSPCKPTYPPMLALNNGLYTLNANPNRPLNCSTPGPVQTVMIRPSMPPATSSKAKTLMTKENYQCACQTKRRNDITYPSEDEYNNVSP